jgi:hypothetical protein
LIGVAETISDEEITVNLITIYDKADTDNISDKELKELIKECKNKVNRSTTDGMQLFALRQALNEKLAWRPCAKRDFDKIGK